MTGELTLNHYQAQALTTAIYPEKGTGSVDAIVYAALGLGEVGEVQNKVKKVLRDHGGELTNEVRIAIAGELGDGFWYMAALADELGFSMEEVALMNLEKLAARRAAGTLQGSGDHR